MNIRLALYRIERALLRGIRFIGDVRYYWWQQRHPFRLAISLARKTIY